MLTETYLIAFMLANLIGMPFAAAIHLLHWHFSQMRDWEYKWLEVVIGVVLTMIPVTLYLGPEITGQILGLFAGIGWPMIAGSIIRHIAERRRHELADERTMMRLHQLVGRKLDGSET